VPAGEFGGVPRLCKKFYPGIRITTEENHGKTSVEVAEKCQLLILGTIRLVDLMSFHGRPRPVCMPLSPLACESGGWGQSSVRYLPSCLTKGFPASAIFESKLTVRALMWSANNGTP
jgi:hypothetical protein